MVLFRLLFSHGLAQLFDATIFGEREAINLRARRSAISGPSLLATGSTRIYVISAGCRRSSVHTNDQHAPDRYIVIVSELAYVETYFPDIMKTLLMRFESFRLRPKTFASDRPESL